MTSLRRLYANTYTDAEKQDAINLLLGNFVPHAGTGHIWDLESDIYLHTTGARGFVLPRLKTLRCRVAMCACRSSLKVLPATECWG